MKLSDLKRRTQAFYLYQILAMEAWKEERYSTAIIFLEKALALDPRNIRLHVKLARAYEKCGKISKAITNYQKVIRLLGWDQQHPLVQEAQKAILRLTQSFQSY